MNSIRSRVGHDGGMPRLVRPDLDPLVEAAIDTLGNRVRVVILEHLLTNGPATRAELSGALGVNVKTLQDHLTALRASGAVKAEPAPEPEQDASGRHVIYSANPERVQALLRTMVEYLGMSTILRPEDPQS